MVAEEVLDGVSVWQFPPFVLQENCNQVPPVRAVTVYDGLVTLPVKLSTQVTRKAAHKIWFLVN